MDVTTSHIRREAKPESHGSWDKTAGLPTKSSPGNVLASLTIPGLRFAD